MRKFIAIAVMIFLLLPVTVLAAFLAVGQNANYADAWPKIEYGSDVNIAVGVHDQRPYILNGEKSPTYTGTVRPFTGNPWNVNTKSDKPLADEIASAVVSGFLHVGTQAQSIPIDFSDSQQAAIGKLRQLGKKRIVLITLREWRSDTYVNNKSLYIDAHLQVYDEKGKEIAISSVSHKNMGDGDGIVDSPEVGAGLHLSRLLNDPNIKTALGSKPVSEIREIRRDGRFIAYNNGTVLDTKTNLMWASKDNGGNINWQNAKSYCENYRGGGHSGWRMPTQNELAELYNYENYATYQSTCTYGGLFVDRKYDLRSTELIRLTCTALWASDLRSSQTAYFHFSEGGKYWDYPSNDDRFRALPVRSAK